MTQSENINELATALSKAQGEMQPAITANVGHFNNKYADLGSVWNAARPVLAKYGLCVMQTTEMNDDWSKIMLITTLSHTSGQWMKSFIALNPAKNDSQGVGGAMTYFRRYSLVAILGIVCDEDDDGEEAVGRGKTASPQQSEKPESKPDFISEAEANELIFLSTKLDDESMKALPAWIKKTYNVAGLRDIPKSGFEKCKTNLTAKIKYLNDKNKQQTGS